MKRMNNKGGFSLVELAIGLAVITVLILAISLSSGIRENARVQSAAQSVDTLRSASEGYLAAGNSNYASLTVARLQLNNLLPSTFSGTSTNPWGGNFTLVPNAASSNTKVDIALTSVPQAEATKLTTYFNNNATTGYDATSKTWTATF